MATKRDIEKLDYHCGDESNIPKCCQHFFVHLWQDFVISELSNSENEVRYSFRVKMGRWYRKNVVNKVKAGYIVCPICYIRGKKIEVRKCEYSSCSRCPRLNAIGGR